MDPTPDSESSPTLVPYPSANFGNVVSAVRDLKHPTQIGPYYIQSLIGEGGMGTVYKAEQREPIHRIVALKIIKLGMDTRQVIARFESERQAIAMMDHVNVARVLDAGATDTGRPYFVMEYVQGEPITAFADRKKLTVRERLELFTQACAAVQHAHQKAIIHRDLKPSNILVMLQDDKPIVKVIDFGVAKATAQKLTERTLFTETGQLVGTPEYMAPEQADATIKTDVDTRSDVYSLGVVLYELISGSLPFDAHTLRSAGYQEIQRIIRDVDPPRPSTRLSSLGAQASEVAKLRRTPLDSLQKQLKSELEWIPLKAMRKERENRYSSPAELADDIENYLENRPLRAGPESATYRFRKFVRRNKTGVAASAAMVLLLIVGIATTTWQAVAATRARQRAEQANAVSTQVNRLMRDMLSAARPEIAAGREITVRELVEQATRTLPQQVSSQPLVLAGVQHTLGNTWMSLGRPEQAIEYLRETVRTRQRELGESDPDTLEAAVDLATALQQGSKLDESEKLVRATLEHSRKAHGNDAPATLNAELLLAKQLAVRGDFPESLRLATHGLESSQRLYGPGDPRTIRAASELGYLLTESGQLPEAEKYLRQALEASQKTFGEAHPETTHQAGNLALVMMRMGRAPEAIALRQANIETYRRVLGPQHPTTLSELDNLGFMYQVIGRIKEAEALHREAMEKGRVALGPDHFVTMTATMGLGTTLQELSRFEESEPLLRAVLEHRTRTEGPESPGAMAAANNLARTLRNMGRVSEAEVLYRQSVEGTRRIFGPAHANTMGATTNLAMLLVSSNRAPEAEQLMRPLVELSTKTYGPGHPSTLDARIGLGRALLEQQKYEEAEVVLRQGLDDAAAAGLQDSLIQSARRYRAIALAKSGRPEEALALFQQVRSDSKGPYNLLTSFGDEIVVGMLGCYDALRDYPAAEKLLLDVQKQIDARASPNLNAARRNSQRFVELYTKWNRPDAARKYQQKLDELGPASAPAKQQ